MTKVLQRRFVIASMAAISVLLLVLVGAINFVNFSISARRVEQVLSQLVESEGLYTPPSMQQDNPPHGPNAPTPDDMMGARYFFVRFDGDGAIVQTNVSHILAVTEDEALCIAQQIYQGGSQSGYTGSFRYRVAHALDGRSSLVICLDISSQQRSAVTVLLVSVFVGLLCWLAMLMLVMLLSKRAIRPIAITLEKQKQFVTNAGHELKTPLAILLANTDAMELHQGETKWSRNIRTQTVRLNGLMQNLLVLAKMDEGGDSLPTSEFSLSLLIEEVLDFYQEAAAAKGIVLRSIIQPEVMLRANRESIVQLLSVLLDNAVQYTPADGSIQVVLTKGKSGIVFQVENSVDTPPEGDLERLFDRFYRGDPARTQKSGGYGIGLSTARAVAEAHGGTITARCDGPRATMIFTVKLS